MSIADKKKSLETTVRELFATRYQLNLTKFILKGMKYGSMERKLKLDLTKCPQFFDKTNKSCEKTKVSQINGSNSNYVEWYSQTHLFGSLQNISAPVGLIEKLRPLYYVHRPFRF